MSRRLSVPVPAPFLALLILAGAAVARADGSLIERARPDPARQARAEAWLERFEAQRPALTRAQVELGRELDGWRSSRSDARCQRARRALAEVDRPELVAVADYRVTSAMARALLELEGAVHACLMRRYFELDYRLGLAHRELRRARDLALAQADG